MKVKNMKNVTNEAWSLMRRSPGDQMLSPARKIVAKGLDADEVTAKDIMTTDLLTIEPEKSLYDAMLKLNKKKITHLPVVKDNEIVGMISSMDILKVQPSYMEILAGPRV